MIIKKEKLELLHSIRGFAALLVVIGHAKFHFWSGGAEFIKHYPMNLWNFFDYLLFAFDMLTSNPALMVVVFFVLSGFFIAYSFDSNQWSLSNFYINRTIRIYIPYLSSLLFTVLLFYLTIKLNSSIFQSINPSEYNQGLVAHFNHFDIQTFLWNLIFVANPYYIGYNDPYWSLLIEAFFYIVAPFFIKRPKLFMVISGFLLIIGLYFGTYLSFINLYNPLKSFITLYAFFFALGFYTYWLIFKYRIQDVIKRINVWWYNSFAIFLLLTAIYGIFIFDYKYTYLIGGLFTVLMIYRLIIYPVKSSYVVKFFISMGKISYSMYLIHVPIFILMYALLVKFTGQEVFYARIYWIPTIIVVLLSYPFYYLVEHQTLKMIKWYKKKCSSKS